MLLITLCCCFSCLKKGLLCLFSEVPGGVSTPFIICSPSVNSSSISFEHCIVGQQCTSTTPLRVNGFPVCTDCFGYILFCHFLRVSTLETSGLFRISMYSGMNNLIYSIFFYLQCAVNFSLLL